MIDLRLAHTADLAPPERAAARALLYDVFDDMTEADWEHALGGIHAFVKEGDDVIAHASLIIAGSSTAGAPCAAGMSKGWPCARTDAAGVWAPP